jgi:hypothetical protein
MIKTNNPLNRIRKRRKVAIKKTLLKKPTEKTNVSSNVTFAPNFEKKLTNKQKQDFWNRYFSQESKQFIEKRKIDKKPVSISEYNKEMIIFKASPTVLATVRNKFPVQFKDYLLYYLRLKKHLPFLNKKLTCCQIVLCDLLSIYSGNRKKYILERVFPSISVFDFLYYGKLPKLSGQKRNSPSFQEALEKNRFFPSFIKNLEKNKINLEKFERDLNVATYEFEKVFQPVTDSSLNNLIILDYNKITGKFKFGLIDYIGEHSKSL